MTEDAQLIGPGTEAMPLVDCPLCGADEGYSLGEGSTFRWYSLTCCACGQEVDEIRIAADPIAAWNKAGAYAAGLRAEIERLREHAVILAETARQVERERCAAVCDGVREAADHAARDGHRKAGAMAAAASCAKLIRA